MPPELQKILDAQNQAAMQSYQQAADVGAHFKILVYSSYVALLVCAVFSVLIFWKLCQIYKTLKANAPTAPANLEGNYSSTQTSQAEQPAPEAERDDSRFMPQ